MQADDQKSAASQAFTLDVFNPGQRVIDRRHQHTLKLAREQTLDQPLVLGLDLYKVRERAERVYPSRVLTG